MARYTEKPPAKKSAPKGGKSGGGKSDMAGKTCPTCGSKLDGRGYCAKCKRQY